VDGTGNRLPGHDCYEKRNNGADQVITQISIF
jgi:hypothetical protein